MALFGFAVQKKPSMVDSILGGCVDRLADLHAQHVLLVRLKQTLQRQRAVAVHSRGAAAAVDAGDVGSAEQELALLLDACVGTSANEVRIAKGAIDAVTRPAKEQIVALLSQLGWPAPAASLHLNDKLVLARFSDALRNLARIHNTLSKSKIAHVITLDAPLACVFDPVLTRVKFHFFTSSSTNRIDKPEWLLKYVMQIIDDHSVFLDLMQDILNELPENTLLAKTEYISHMMLFVTDRIQFLALHSLDDSPLFSHLITEVIRFDKTLQKVHNYYRTRYPANLIHSGPLLDVFCQNPQLFRRWLDIEREVAQLRFNELMNVADPWIASVSASESIKHTMSSENLVDLLDIITDRYRNLSPVHQIAFIEGIQLSLLSRYLSAAKDRLNALQSTFEPAISDDAVLRKFSRLEASLKLTSGLDAVVQVVKRWGEDTLFLEMLEVFKTLTHANEIDPAKASMFVSVESDYGKVIRQVEGIVAEDCCQYVVESMWRFDQKKWNIHSTDSDPYDTESISPELQEALRYTSTILAMFDVCLPTKLRKDISRIFLGMLVDRLMVRPIGKCTFSEHGAVLLKKDVDALLGTFPVGVVRLVAGVKRFLSRFLSW
ncbi:TIP-1 family-domain-containing protein [Chytriomyces sp. MP71]|nr:TIP-1 family-domain-containing protein [Chytriomyces sp. MP71]